MIRTRTDPSDMLHRQVEDNAEVRTCENVGPKNLSHSCPFKKRKITDDKPTISQSSKSPKDKEFDEKGAKIRQDKKVTEVTEGPETEGPDAVSVLHDSHHTLTAFLKD